VTTLTQTPAQRINIIDPRTGLMAREWFLFFNGLLEATGASSGSIGGYKSVTTSYTPTNNDKHLLCNGTLTITLQDPALRDDELIVTNVGTGTISFIGTINGDPAKQIAFQYTSLRLRPIGTSYVIV